MYKRMLGPLCALAVSLALSPANAGETTVVQKDKTFQPGDITLKVGDTVRFENPKMKMNVKVEN